MSVTSTTNPDGTIGAATSRSFKSHESTLDNQLQDWSEHVRYFEAGESNFDIASAHKSNNELSKTLAVQKFFDDVAQIISLEDDNTLKWVGSLPSEMTERAIPLFTDGSTGIDFQLHFSYTWMRALHTAGTKSAKIVDPYVHGLVQVINSRHLELISDPNIVIPLGKLFINKDSHSTWIGYEILVSSNLNLWIIDILDEIDPQQLYPDEVRLSRRHIPGSRRDEQNETQSLPSVKIARLWDSLTTLHSATFEKAGEEIRKFHDTESVGFIYLLEFSRTMASRAIFLSEKPIYKIFATSKFKVAADSRAGRELLCLANDNAKMAIMKLILKDQPVSNDITDPQLMELAFKHKDVTIAKLLLKSDVINLELVNDLGKELPSHGFMMVAKHAATIATIERAAKVASEDIDISADSKNSFGQMPLSWAAEGVHEAVVKLLLETGQVDLDAKDMDGRAPLSRAAREGYEAVVKLLLETGQVDVDAKDVDGRTPLLWATIKRHEAVVKLLLKTGQVDVNAKDMGGWTPLSWAAREEHEAVVKLLLKTGQVDVNAKDIHGWTPLSRAATEGREAIVKLLLETGQVDVDAKDMDGSTPLSWAAREGHEAVVKLLLETGQVDVNAKDIHGRTPLSWAVRWRRDAVVKLLLETGQVDVDVDAKDVDGWTPLLWAARMGHEAVVKLLLETGQVDVDVDAKDMDGWTPLLWAAREGHEAVVKLLLETGQVDVDAKDMNGSTPLSWAAREGHEAVVKLLLETGQVDVNAKDKDGWTPLLWATIERHEATEKLLLETGQVDVNAKDKDGWTPLSQAPAEGREAMVKLMLETDQAALGEGGNRRTTTRKVKE